MVNNEANSNKSKQDFQYCPNCGRKGLYHIKGQYYRCRYCGTYMITSRDKDEPKKPE